MTQHSRQTAQSTPLLRLLLLCATATATVCYCYCSAAAANNRCTVIASTVGSVLETFVYFMYAHSTPRALAYVNAQPPRHGVIKRTIEGSLARNWPPPLPRRRRTAAAAGCCSHYCCWACLLLLPIIVVLLLILLCACY